MRSSAHTVGLHMHHVSVGFGKPALIGPPGLTEFSLDLPLKLQAPRADQGRVLVVVSGGF